MIDPKAQHLTVKECASRFSVRVETILRLINTGELEAIDISLEFSARPSWRITEKAIREFEKLRSTKMSKNGAAGRG